MLEERVAPNGTVDPDPLAQYVYHPYYVDAVAVRFYDADTDGSGIDEHYYLHDANFNVTAITNDSGSVVERYGYTPYGEVTVLDAGYSADANNQSDIGNEYMYTGRRRDPSGLQLNRNRFYHAGLGRWLTRDPIGHLGGGYNLYEYVNGRALVGLDPEGLLTCWEQDTVNQRERTACRNECSSPRSYMPTYRKCRAAGGSIEECRQQANDFIDQCQDGCDSRFPDLDCDDYCYFDPNPCIPLGLKLLAWESACMALPGISGFLCGRMNPYKEPYEECMENEAVK